ncbi:hypothetical protein SUGI_0907230 [Cryptomeria japonica]|uniref:VIN3-like protein 2 isoform X1 n=2 Tax=Cryptomeria japonica TaxID=3369 RepID=UPI00241495FF|nr:VIN3-like protein 2 isoform X1 [Cryptomeria japonica]GLJ43591.1 hypothetical protein SUGI_0907230 [Cryptomeria japonica]
MPKSGPKFSRLDSSSTGLEMVSSNPGDRSLSEKHDLVYEIAKWPEGASEILQSWTRREILQVLCAEMGKERKYTGLSKCKIIEQLLRLVSSKEAMKEEAKVVTPLQSSVANTKTFRRQRKREHPLRLTTATNLSASPDEKSLDNSLVCKNLACRAILSSEDIFCKRCSCCICHQFDDNKDPSLWLVCTSEPPFEGDSCGMSCHVECALKHERSTISKDGQFAQLDGSYCCMSCGKVNGLLGCWRKQLVVAKDARRVDILCFRISLSHRLLNGTVQYKELHEIVEMAAKKLEEEVGPVTGVNAKMARGIVSRLSSGSEVQKLCAMAIEEADAMLSWVSQANNNVHIRGDLVPIATRIEFDDISSTSVVIVLNELDCKSSEDVIGYKLWYRKIEERSYCEEPTHVILRTERRSRISNLQPSTEYIFKIVSFTKKGLLGYTENRCSTKSEDKNHRNVESRTRELWTSGKLGSENLSSISTEEEILLNEGASNLKVRDLGKVLLAASTPKRKSNGTLECLEKDLSSKHCFPYCEKPQACSNKTFHSSNLDVNESLTPQFKTSKDENTGCNLTESGDPEDAHGDSVSALDEERAMVETGLMQTSRVQADSQRDSTNSSDNNQVTELPKSDHENHSKVTLLEETSNDNEFSMPPRNEMDVVPFDCSHPVLPISICKGDDTGTGILRNGHTKPNGSSENWAVKPIKEVAAMEPQIGGSRKRSNRYGDLHNCDRTLPNGIRRSSLDSPGSLEKNYEYCVKMIRWLECKGHIQKEFRIKFLTWFSLRATSQERRIVSVFVDTMSDDPASLAGQLVDTFSEGVYSKRAKVLRNGFCSKLWH